MSRVFTSKSLIPWGLVTAVAILLITLAVGRGAASVLGSGSYAASSSASLPNPPAVTQGSLLADIASWPVANGNVEGVTYTFRYPPTWSNYLVYCAPGAAKDLQGTHLPANCASTDVLVGQKARDVGLLTGEAFMLSGRNARKAISEQPASALVSRTYTVMVYDASGTALFGFSTQIGAETSAATLNDITSLLDAMASTIKVEVRR